jgi:Protein of unknown function (DUF3592)
MVRRRRPGRRANLVIAIILLAGLTVYGAVSLGLGISGFVNSRELATSGVPTVARVTATSGYGKDTIQVSYQVDGRATAGTVGANPSSVYPGEMLSVVYDPSSPGVVSLASDAGDTSSAWADTITGAIFLLLVPVSFLLTIIGRRRRRRRAINAALGE